MLVAVVIYKYNMDVRLNKQLTEKQNQQSSLSLFHQNIRGLNDKCEELIFSLLANSIKPYMICLTEHYTTEHNLLLIYLENYTVAANYSRINCTRGGACIFVRNDMTPDTLSLVWKKFLEPCSMKINHVKFNWIVIWLYRSPSGNFVQFLHFLHLMLKSFYTPGLQLTFCGNFLTDSCHKTEIIYFHLI
jgi:hypothetical protein